MRQTLSKSRRRRNVCLPPGRSGGRGPHGLIRIELSRTIGRRHVTLQELRAGDVVGGVPAFLGEAELFDARAGTERSSSSTHRDCLALVDGRADSAAG